MTYNQYIFEGFPGIAENIYAEFQEKARKQGASQEEVDLIPAMIRALILQTVCEDYTGPTPEEVNPEFFQVSGRA